MKTPWMVALAAAMVVGCGTDDPSPMEGAARGGDAGQGATGSSGGTGTDPGKEDAGTGGDDTTPPEPNPGPKTSKTFTSDSTTNFLNPERGFHREVNILTGNFASIRGDGYSFVRATVRLDDYRNSAIPSSLLDNLRTGLGKLRTSGLKISLRFAYNASGSAADAPLNIVTNHIDQLKPVFTEYADVIGVLQAGFIGAWGEWHSSTNNLTSPENMKTIGEALLGALPQSRMIQVRTPGRRRAVVGVPSGNVTFFDGSNQARIGLLNDCFLAGPSDAGTYSNDTDRDEAADYSRYTPTGGETCEVSYPHARQECASALGDLAKYNWDYLSSNYYSGILNKWKSDGCYDEIARRLGYRLALESVAATTTVARGGSLTLDVTMKNEGFGKVYNSRPLDVVLRDGSGGVHALRAASDARSMLPLGGKSNTFQVSVKVPSDLPAGDYALLLGLPDPSSELASDPRFSIRLANSGVWGEATGFNDLGMKTTVTE